MEPDTWLACDFMSDFSQKLLTWYNENGRHDLPWQVNKTPYRVWVSEIMLQQTQVLTVVPYFESFMTRFPGLPDLAQADLDDVLALWSGLGYYSRARNLHKTATRCYQEHAGDLPANFEELMDLPGIGRSTAGAILAIAFGQRFPILDGNVKRVLARFHALPGWTGEKRVVDRLWEIADMHTPAERVGDYTQAIMDLGATLCVRRNPRCQDCVQFTQCLAAQAGTQNEHPAPRPKKTTPTRECWMLVAQNKAGSILLERRPPTGIWGGLWSLPQFETRQALEQHVALRWPGSEAVMPNGEPFRHGFTHFKLIINPVLLPAGSPEAPHIADQLEQWVGPEQAEKLGLPQPIRRLLSRAFTDTLTWQEQLEL